MGPRRAPTPRAIALCRMGMQVAELLACAEVADAEPLPKGLNLPSSWRGVRGACKASARRRLRSRPAPLSALPVSRPTTKPRGRRKRSAPVRSPAALPRHRSRPVPAPKTRINLTDLDSRILPTAGGFEQSYTAAVDTDTMLVVAKGLSQAANDKQQITACAGSRPCAGSGRW
jgi:hypothetical protein